MDRLHSATRAITDGRDPDVALGLARALAQNPPADWDAREWLSIAAAANAKASDDPLWLKVKVVACENQRTSTAPINALWARARLMAALGRDDTDEFRSLAVFLERAEEFVRADAPDATLASYRAARATILSAEQSSAEWVAARDTFLRCRRLREFAKIARAVVEDGRELPAHLEQWTSWADLKEEELSLVDS